MMRAISICARVQTQRAARLAQDIFNLLPNMNVEAMSKALSVKSNDMMLVIYVASLIRSILALHKLIDNKEQRLWSEKEAIKSKVICLAGMRGVSSIKRRASLPTSQEEKEAKKAEEDKKQAEAKEAAAAAEEKKKSEGA